MILLRCLAALLVGLVTLAGCEKFDRALTGNPPAQGPVPEVVVVADSQTYAGPVGDALREVFSTPLGTLPNRQGPFKMRRMDPENRLVDRVRSLRLIIYAAPLDQQSRVGEYMRGQFDPAAQAAIREGRAKGIYIRENVWANGQLVASMTGASDTTLAREILQRGPELVRRFNVLARDATAADIFGQYRQTDLEQEMLDRLGLGVKVQYDYVKAHDTTATVDGRTGQFMRYRRVLTDTWRDYFLFVEDGVSQIPDNDALDRLTDGLLAQFALGTNDGSFVQMDPLRPVSRDTVTIDGNLAREKRGLWFMTEDLMGGSYVRYATILDGKLVLFYGMTFAPDRALDKREFLRQLEATAFTLRTAREAAASPPS